MSQCTSFSLSAEDLVTDRVALQNLPPTSETPGLTASRPDLEEKISDFAPSYGSPNQNPIPDKDAETLKETGSPPPRTPLGNIDAHSEAATRHEEPGRSKKRRGSRFWILVALVGLLVLAIALGVGLGVGLTRHKNSKSSSRCGSFRTALWNHHLPYQVLLHRQKTLRHYLMGYSTIRR